MVRTYIRKTPDPSWSHEAMHKAAEQVLLGNMKCMTAAKAFNVPFRTLRRRIYKCKERIGPNVDLNAVASACCPKTRMIFAHIQEIELAKLAVQAASIFLGLTSKEMRSLAFKFAEKHVVGVPNGWRKTGMASEDWYWAFIKRHPQLTGLASQARGSRKGTDLITADVLAFFDQELAKQKVISCPSNSHLRGDTMAGPSGCHEQKQLDYVIFDQVHIKEEVTSLLGSEEDRSNKSFEEEERLWNIHNELVMVDPVETRESFVSHSVEIGSASADKKCPASEGVWQEKMVNTLGEVSVSLQKVLENQERLANNQEKLASSLERVARTQEILVETVNTQLTQVGSILEKFLMCQPVAR